MDRRADSQRGAWYRGRSSGLRTLLAIGLLAIVIPAGLSASGGSSPVHRLSTRSSFPSTPDAFRPGVVLVGFHAGLTAGQRYAIEHAAGGEGAALLGPPIRPVRNTTTRAPATQFVPALKLRVPASQVLAVVRRLRLNPNVAYAEPDYLMTASATPNDPSFPLQWGSSNTGQSIPTQGADEKVGEPAPGTPGADDRALAAWGVSTGSRSIVIGEADTGIDYNHPDLAANIWSNPGGIGGCAAGTHGYNVVASTCNPMDDDTTYGGHGTHVAGIMGAVGNNGAGVAGMNWQTTILPVKWLDSTASGSTSGLISALQWFVAAKQAGVNVRVVNDSATFYGTAYSQALSEEIDVLGANNILFVTAAGNTGNNNDELSVRRYPCGYDRPNEICVTATDHNDQLPSWANYGPHTVDLAAPGASIYSTLRNGTYGYLTGGSMASPQVAGAAALILSVSPSLSATELKSDILTHVDPLPSLAGKVITGGRLNVCKALPGCREPARESTFGKSTVGASTDSGMYANYKIVHAATLPVAGSVTKLSVYAVPGVNSPSPQTLKAVIYADSEGSPGALVATGSEVTYTGSTNGSGWFTLPLASPVKLSAGNYWIGFITGATTEGMGYTYDSVANSRAYNENSYAGGPTNPFGPATKDSHDASLYATYTTGETGSVPVNTGAPSISGSAKYGQTLTAGTGSWTESPTSYGYRWQRCDTTGANCAPIEGASASTYPVGAADVGHTLRVTVTASNSSGPSAPASSLQTAVVEQASATFGKTSVGASSDSYAANRKRVSRYALPVAGKVNKLSMYLAPAKTSGQQVLEGLIYADSSGSPGALLATTTPLTFKSTNTAGWYDLPFATAPALTSGNYWIGVITGGTANVTGFRFDKVTGTRDYNGNTYTTGPSNPFGSFTTDSEQASIYATYTTGESGSVPANTGLPTISGVAKTGQTLSSSTGSWTESPTSYTYRWQRCDTTGANCAPIEGATATTYTLTSTDIGSTLRVAVTASNSAGTSTPASSAQTAEVKPGFAPTNTAAPTITGTPKSGQTLTDGTGSWTEAATGYTYQWQRCDTTGANCAVIESATEPTYTVKSADIGSTLRVTVTASNSAGASAPASSTQTAEVKPGFAPTNTAAPTITGTAKTGQTLTASTGSWTEVPTSYTYQWQRCDTTGASCGPIEGASAPTYTVKLADLGSTFRVTVTASNSAGTAAPATSVQTAEVTAGSAPLNTAAPTITGTAKVGQMLTASTGTWTESPTSYAYQWQRCDTTGTICLPIENATARTYTVSSADIGSTLLVAVSASNANGPSAPASSTQTAEVKAGSAPTNTAAPTITGTAKTGQTLSASTGSWTGSPTSYAYQWQGCDTTGANCAPIEGATATTYTIRSTDIGSTLRVAVSASNSAGASPPASSAQTAEVKPGFAPTNTAAPTITGSAKTGQTLSASTGLWTESPTGYTYQWQRCDSTGANCAPIEGATAAKYTVKSADIGSTLRVAVSASNSAGTSTPAGSTQTAEVKPGFVPTNTAAPTISGSAKTAQTLSATSGAWTESPSSYAYQWQRCDRTGANCAPIESATEPTYTVKSVDLGSTLRVAVTASNSAGSSTSASSTQTAEVKPGVAPANTAAPTISGTAKTGQTLTATAGSWTEAPTGYAYQWQRCDKAGANCVGIEGATTTAYAINPADAGSTLRVAVTASNSAGASAPASSAPTAEVQQGVYTFGKTTIGASTDMFAADRKRVNRYALSITAAVSKLSIYLAPTGTSGEQVIEGLIYADSSGTPGALLATSTQLTFKSTNTAGWYDLPFATPPALAAGNYWIGVLTGGTSHVAGFRYDSVTGSRDYNSNTYTSGPTNPFGAFTTDAEQTSLYATYSPH
jgi:subtilisin family serine protease/fibronectin type 3 domain-containing protein